MPDNILVKKLSISLQHKDKTSWKYESYLEKEGIGWFLKVEVCRTNEKVVMSMDFEIRMTSVNLGKD